MQYGQGLAGHCLATRLTLSLCMFCYLEISSLQVGEEALVTASGDPIATITVEDTFPKGTNCSFYGCYDYEFLSEAYAIKPVSCIVGGKSM